MSISLKELAEQCEELLERVKEAEEAIETLEKLGNVEARVLEELKTAGEWLEKAGNFFEGTEYASEVGELFSAYEDAERGYQQLVNGARTGASVEEFARFCGVVESYMEGLRDDVKGPLDQLSRKRSALMKRVKSEVKKDFDRLEAIVQKSTERGLLDKDVAESLMSAVGEVRENALRRLDALTGTFAEIKQMWLDAYERVRSALSEVIGPVGALIWAKTVEALRGRDHIRYDELVGVLAQDGEIREVLEEQGTEEMEKSIEEELEELVKHGYLIKLIRM